MTEENLLRMFDRLIEQGAHNLNLVNPTHYAPMLAKALKNTVRLCRLSPIQGDMSGRMLKAWRGSLIFICQI